MARQTAKRFVIHLDGEPYYDLSCGSMAVATDIAQRQHPKHRVHVLDTMSHRGIAAYKRWNGQAWERTLHTDD